MSGLTCRICTRPVASPYRVYNERGAVIAGCVCSDHDGHLVAPSESLRWHSRPEAKRMRRNEGFDKRA